jgi:ribosomal protein S18 acetylase RimI-like enzyme
MTITLRPGTSQDETFFRRLILETIGIELGASAWPEPMRSHLLSIQYEGRRRSYRAGYPETESSVIQVDGEDAGWVAVAALPNQVHLAEIMVLPELRGRGIGTAAIRGILATARDAGKPVRLNVNAMNLAAIRLYERLGFRRIDGDEVQHLMEWAVRVCEGPQA